MTSQKDVTHLLLQWREGDSAALDELIPIVYSEMRRLAGNLLRWERPDHTLQPTALIHEAYLRLIDQHKVRWQNRTHFFAVAAKSDDVLPPSCINRRDARNFLLFTSAPPLPCGDADEVGSRELVLQRNPECKNL